MASTWHDLGGADSFRLRPLTGVTVGSTRLLVTHKGGQFGVLSAVCSHAGGPLEKGRLDGDYVVCPWHAWTFERQAGHCKPPWDHETTPAYAVKVESGRLLVDLDSKTKRVVDPQTHPLKRKPVRAPGPLRVVGISTTVMNKEAPRFSTSEALLEESLRHAATKGAETKMIRLNDLSIRPCEGYYSIAAPACTWPCTITQKDPKDQMAEVYEALVHWADVVLVATPIRWGAASSLYFRMAERLNTVQNQMTTHSNVLIRNKVAAFIVTGGQDNVQAVAGQMMNFFAELGFHFPQFPFIGHSRGWSAEDMERNVAYVQQSDELRQGARSLAERALELAHTLVEHQHPGATVESGGRKASGLVEQAPRGAT
ncbi:MAG: Rieske 2Fe-2S domain-containing protein [Candidatus Thermoplasmatota archaeon]